jgi:hypothetical protein
MLVTLFGITIFVRLAQEENALSPMLVTCVPLIVFGMATLTSFPVYFVMEMEKPSDEYV